MYAKLLIAIIIGMALILLSEGLPGFTLSIKNMFPSESHSSQYNLIFWLMILVSLFALLKPKRGGNS